LRSRDVRTEQGGNSGSGPQSNLGAINENRERRCHGIHGDRW
jgi:hypothetical protein